jgi:hypothetical protein
VQVINHVDGSAVPRTQYFIEITKLVPEVATWALTVYQVPALTVAESL